MTFFVYAIIGLALVPFVLLIREPVRGQQEGFTADHSRELDTEGFRQKVRRILGTKTLAYHYIACMFIQLGGQGFVFWIPTFLVRYRAIDVATAGKIVGGGLLVGGLIGAVGGAALSDYLFRTDKKARLKLLILAGALSIPLMIATLLVTSKALLILALFLTIMINISAFPILNAVIIDLVTPQDKGVAMALLLVIQTGIGLSFGPPLVGLVSDTTGSLLAGMIVGPVSVFLCMIMAFLAMRYVVGDYGLIQQRVSELKAKLGEASA
jgi:MFS family permease